MGTGDREVALTDRKTVPVRITNADKFFFPVLGLTKGDLVQHYVDLADAVLPHVRRRPAQMKRYPNGVEGDFFYQKRVPVPHPDWLETIHIGFPSGRTAESRVSVYGWWGGRKTREAGPISTISPRYMTAISSAR